MITCGSLFAGIGGFELGAQWAFEAAGIPHKVLFQVEQNKFCQKVLKKHWPEAQIFEDVCAVGRHNLPDVDILMGGFPCQDISSAGHQKGIINGKKSSLWFEMLRIIGELRPRIAVLENVPAIIRVGGPVVVGGLAEIGYNCEWQIISAAQFGAPHLRKRWFCVATDTNRDRSRQAQHWRIASADRTGSAIQHRRSSTPDTDRNRKPTGAINAKASGLPSVAGHDVADTHGAHSEREWLSGRVQEKNTIFNMPFSTDADGGRHATHTQQAVTKERQISPSQFSSWSYARSGAAWQEGPVESPLCSMDDGVPNRLARLRSLGNAIVPQCSEFIFEHIIKNVLQPQQQKEQ